MSMLSRLTCVAIVIALKGYAERPPWAAWAAGAILLCAALIEYLVEPTPSMIARIYAARRQVTRIVVVVTIGLGTPLLGVGLVARSSIPPLAEFFSFALQGVLLGVVLRMLLTTYFSRTLRGVPTERLRLFLILALGALFVLLPLGHTHWHLAGLFIVGIGGGFFLHYAVRHNEHENALYQRFLQNILSACTRTQQPLVFLEHRAVEAYATQDWSRLEETIESSPTPRTSFELMRAARERVRGNYDVAIRIVVAELRRAKRDTSIDNLLHLALALNLGERGERDAMHAELARATAINHHCMLTNTTIALRRAEEISIDDALSNNEPLRGRKAEAMSRIWIALDLFQRREVERIEALIVGSTVSINRTLLQDAYAYVLMKIGRDRMAWPIFMQCVAEDPLLSSTYLHLGEYHLIQRARRRLASQQSGREVDAAAEERDVRLARISLHIASRLERGRRSLVAARAKELLQVCAAGSTERSVVAGTGGISVESVA